VPKLFINFVEILSCAYGNFEEKNKVFEPSKKNCLNTNAYYNIKASSRNEIRKNVSINWSSYCFIFEEEIVKRFVQCQAFMDSPSLKRGPICSETSIRNYHYSCVITQKSAFLNEVQSLEHQKVPAKRHSVTFKNTGIFNVTTGRTKLPVFLY